MNLRHPRNPRLKNPENRPIWLLSSAFPPFLVSFWSLFGLFLVSFWSLSRLIRKQRNGSRATTANRTGIKLKVKYYPLAELYFERDEFVHFSRGRC